MGKNTILIDNLKKQAEALLASNQLTGAKDIHEQLCQLAPEDVDNWVRLGVTWRRLRNFNAAEQCCRHALALVPEYPPAHQALGAALQQQRRLEEALACYREAVRLDPDLVEARYFLANALREGDHLDAAITAYRQLLKLKPDHFEGLNNLGILLTHQGHDREAVSHLQHALQLQPDNVATLTNLGDALVSMSRYEEALGHLRHALRIKPEFVNAQRALANTLHHSGKMHEALAGYRSMEKLAPGSQDAILGQARILEQLGKYPQVHALLQPLLGGGCDDAIHTFFNISRHIGRREEAVAGLEKILQRHNLRDAAAASVHFKLGKHHDETGDYDQAFHHYQQANVLTPGQFNRDKLVRFVNDNISIYSQPFVQRMPHAENRSELPVFIVGMPRSGTSLIEQILASHPEVAGAGELPHIFNIVQQYSIEYPGQIFPMFIQNLTQGSIDSVAQGHLQELQKLGGGASRVTDKMPYNFRHIGLIAQLFPAARIIHCTRHPLDICLSCFFARFGTVTHGFSYDLKMIGEYYLQYHRLMQHWETVFQNRILRVPYAQLVQEQEKVSRQLTDFCGLEWDQRCLDFHQTDRFVFTLSYDQVRQPMYTRSLDRWRHYEKHLQPLRDLLEAGGVSCG